MRALSQQDYAALTPPMKAVSWDHFGDLAKRGLVVVTYEGRGFDVTPYGALAVRVYEAWCRAQVTV